MLSLTTAQRDELLPVSRKDPDPERQLRQRGRPHPPGGDPGPLEGEGRIEGHLLPSSSPDLNPIERVGWPRHETITRNQRGKDLSEFLDQVFAGLGQETPFQIEGSVYPKAKAA